MVPAHSEGYGPSIPATHPDLGSTYVGASSAFGQLDDRRGEMAVVDEGRDQDDSIGPWTSRRSTIQSAAKLR